MGKSVMILSKTVDLNPGSGEWVSRSRNKWFKSCDERSSGCIEIVIRGGSKHAPGIVDAALDFGAQVAQGENVGNASVKTGVHLAIGLATAKAEAAIGSAIPIPVVGTVIGAGLGFLAGVAGS